MNLGDLIFGVDKSKCYCCNTRFYSQYENGGYIEHNNHVQGMGSFVDAWDTERKDKNKLFLRSINLEGNFCSIKSHSYYVGVEIFNCYITYLKYNQRLDIVDYLESRRNDIKVEYNKITLENIKELELKIEQYKSTLIK